MDKTTHIKKLLKKAGVTQLALAKMLNVTPVAIHNVVSGKRRTPRIRMAISFAVSVPENELWPDTAREKENPSPEHK